MDSKCASPLEVASGEPLGSEWDAWLAWGARLELPSMTPIDPTKVEIADIPHHAVLARHATMRFEADGPSVADAGGTSFMFPVFVIDTAPELKRVRIVSEYRGANLFVWVDQADLLPVPTARVRLSQGGSSDGTEATGVWLTPGRIVEGVELDADQVRVSTTFGGLRVEGTLAREQLGYIFDHDFIKPADDKPLWLRVGEILARPAGTPIATPDPESDATDIRADVSVIRSRGRWSLVEVVEDGGEVVVRGYVEAKAVSRAETGHFYASPYGSAFDPNPKQDPPPKEAERRLFRGTRLLAEGQVVGTVRWSPYDLPDCGDDHVGVPTRWGALVLRVDDRGVVPPVDEDEAIWDPLRH